MMPVERRTLRAFLWRERDVPEFDRRPACAAMAVVRVRAVSRISGSVSRIFASRPIEAAPCWRMLITQPKAIIGQMSMHQVSEERRQRADASSGRR